MRRSLVLGIGLAVAAAIGAGVWWWHGHRAPPPTQWQGYADADFVKVGPTQQGLLTALNVARGDQVAAGAPLFSQDDTADRAARDQAVRQVHQAQEQLANLQASSKPTEIEQAEANLADARATLARTKADLERGEFLASTGTMAAETLDQRRADFRSATAKVAALEAALAQARAPYGRALEIEAQQAAMRASKAALEIAEWRLSQRHVNAPAAGRITTSWRGPARPWRRARRSCRSCRREIFSCNSLSLRPISPHCISAIASLLFAIVVRPI